MTPADASGADPADDVGRDLVADDQTPARARRRQAPAGRGTDHRTRLSGDPRPLPARAPDQVAPVRVEDAGQELQAPVGSQVDQVVRRGGVGADDGEPGLGHRRRGRPRRPTRYRASSSSAGLAGFLDLHPRISGALPVDGEQLAVDRGSPRDRGPRERLPWGCPRPSGGPGGPSAGPPLPACSGGLPLPGSGGGPPLAPASSPGLAGSSAFEAPAGRLPSRAGGLGVRVGVARQHQVADGVLDEVSARPDAV